VTSHRLDLTRCSF